MFIKIDNRETDLLTTMNLLFQGHNHQIKLENLAIGDIILYADDNEQGQEKEKIIFERKSLYDLAASIKDGRYSEQSYRLNNCDCHNHNIVYVIEGDLERYNAQKGRMDKKTLYSALITLNYFKGFSVIRTKNVNETCELIIHYADKLGKESKKSGFYDENKVEKEVNYCEVIKKQKKNNITGENIGEIMLTNIPCVSSKSAIAIMLRFKTIKNLIDELITDDKCLDGIKLITPNGNERKINKSCIENIKKFLLG
jgi:ERCC4-type nuclease